jgi:hypothetical protein
MRVFSTLLELVGVAFIVAGVAMWNVPAAVIVAGLSVVVLGFLAEPDA